MNSRKTRIKLLFLILFSTLMVFFRNLYAVFGITTIIVFVSMLKLNFLKLKNRLVPLFFVSLLIIIFQLLFGLDSSLYLRLFQGLTAALRLLSLSLLVFLFTETTSVTEIVAAFSFLPPKLNLMITISFSLIPVILKEISTIRIAQQSRGLQLKGRYMFRSILPILIPLLGRTLARAEQIAIVLQTRGFKDT